MTRAEFTACMAYLVAGVGKPMADATAEVYFDLLGDLDAAALGVACRVALLEVQKSEYPTIPAAGVLRRHALSVSQEPEAMTPAKAWAIAWRWACWVDPENRSAFLKNGNLYDSQTHYAMSQMPPAVAQAVKEFGGLHLLANSDGRFAQGAFLKIAEAVLASERRLNLLAEVQERKPLPGPTQKILAAIGGKP